MMVSTIIQSYEKFPDWNNTLGSGLRRPGTKTIEIVKKETRLEFTSYLEEESAQYEAGLHLLWLEEA
jgi:hypothetical protein